MATMGVGIVLLGLEQRITWRSEDKNKIGLMGGPSIILLWDIHVYSTTMTKIRVEVERGW